METPLSDTAEWSMSKAWPFKMPIQCKPGYIEIEKN